MEALTPHARVRRLKTKRPAAALLLGKFAGASSTARDRGRAEEPLPCGLSLGAHPCHAYIAPMPTSAAESAGSGGFATYEKQAHRGLVGALPRTNISDVDRICGSKPHCRVGALLGHGVRRQEQHL